MNTIPRMYLGVLLSVHKAMENWTGREYAELKLSEHAVVRHWDNRSDPVEDKDVEVYPGGAKKASFPPQFLAGRGSIYTPSVSYMEEVNEKITTREI